MNYLEQFAELASYSTEDEWRDRIFKLARKLGYEHSLLALFPDRHAPVEVENAFLHSNYSSRWRNKYDEEKMVNADPTVAHCAAKSIPLIWSPSIFSTCKQKALYEEACSHGLQSGVTLPIHGSNGELGMLCFVSDAKPDKKLMRDVAHSVPALSCLRDYIFDTSLQFMTQPNRIEPVIMLTPRELECLKWCASGKSSWDIGQILRCSASAVDFHFTNIRRKFGVSTRNQAVVKAVRMGIITPT